MMRFVELLSASRSVSAARCSVHAVLCAVVLGACTTLYSSGRMSGSTQQQAQANPYARDVLINGQRARDEDLALLDTLNCGTPVPDGIYWLDLNAGTWSSAAAPGWHPILDCNGKPLSGASEMASTAAPEEGDGSVGTEPAESIESIRREREMSRYQTEITAMENNGGNYVP